LLLWTPSWASLGRKPVLRLFALRRTVAMINSFSVKVSATEHFMSIVAFSMCGAWVFVNAFPQPIAPSTADHRYNVLRSLRLLCTPWPGPDSSQESKAQTEWAGWEEEEDMPAIAAPSAMSSTAVWTSPDEVVHEVPEVPAVPEGTEVEDTNASTGKGKVKGKGKRKGNAGRGHFRPGLDGGPLDFANRAHQCRE
jgi:hypothetical protein